MKRVLSLVLTVVICLAALTSCDAIGKGIRRVFGTDIPDGYLEEAKSVIYFNYKDITVTDSDFEVVSTLIIDTVTVSVEWTTDNELVKIRESEKEGYVTVDVPEPNASGFGYELTATMSIENNVSVATVTFRYTVPVINESTTDTPTDNGNTEDETAEGETTEGETTEGETTEGGAQDTTN